MSKPLLLLVVLRAAVVLAEDVCPAQRSAPSRACVTDSDCAVVTQRLDCCGSQAMKGINRAGVARFEAEERACSKNGNQCKCEAAPTQLDEGTLNAKGEVLVACRAKVCTTFLARLTSRSVKALPACAKEACGPAPRMPNSECADGVSVSGPGPCVMLDGKCRWARLECP